MKINKPIDLRKLIFEKVSQEQIFRYYYPYKFTLNQRCLSCFQKENHPSMIIGTKSQSGDIIFKCFNSKHQGDCISFVMQLHDLDYLDALEKIAQDFGLKDSSNTKYEQIIKELPKTTVIKQKKAPDIVVATRQFNREELSYWNDYYQDIEDLKRENVYVPRKIWINRNLIELKSTELTFCYYYPEIDKWKIYKPLVAKERKWFTNVNFDYIENIENVIHCPKVLISKSKKDKMVLDKALNFTCLITTQAEDITCFNEHSIEVLKTCKEVYTVYDNDLKGKTASWALTTNYGWKHCNVPDRLLKEGISDFADFAKFKGIEKVYNHFVKKNII